MRPCRIVGLEPERPNDIAGGDRVADCDSQLFHRAGIGSRNVHCGLVGFERDEPVFALYLLARCYEYFDDFDVREVTEVWDHYLDCLGHAVDRAYSVTGSGRSGSISYFSMARATVFWSSAPSSARALSAVIAM